MYDIFYHLLGVLSSDSILPSTDPLSDFKLQRWLMHHLIDFDRIAICRRESIITGNDSSGAECAWNGVTCHDGVITKIAWSLKEYRIFPEWCPPTARVIDFENQRILNSVRTSILPRNLGDLQMNSCEITGEIDLTRLPQKLKNCHFKQNRISGTVSLLYLPENLVYLDLNGNNLRVYGIDGCLPKSLVHVFLNEKSFDSYVSLDGSERDPRIQLGFNLELLDQMGDPTRMRLRDGFQLPDIF